MRIYLVIQLLYVIGFCNAQEPPAVYGKVKLDEVIMKEYPKDKNAEAIVMYDIGKSYFTRTDRGFELIFERATKIKIFKKSGFRWAEVEIPYYYEGDIFEDVSDVEANSYNVEGGVIKKTSLERKAVYDEKRDEYWRIKKFAIPEVKEGSVIEFKYSIRSSYLFNLRDWEFQHTIPTLYSEYTTKMIPFYEYIYILQGKDKFDVFDSHEDTGLENQFGSIKYHDMVYKFGMKDVPAFNDESFITSRNDYILKMDFQLAKIHHPDGYKKEIISTWPKLNNDLLKTPEFGKYLAASEKEAKDILNPLSLAGKNKLEQLEYIVNLVKGNFNWNGSNGKYAQKTLKEFLKEKTGNSTNLNLFLAGLLKYAGFETYPIMISTREHGKIRSDYPFLHFFNYVIVLVSIDGKYVLTDATESSCPFNRIPSRCINETGLIIKKDGQDWVNLGNTEPSIVDKTFYLKYTNELDTINCANVYSFSLYESYDYKKAYVDNLEKIQKDLYKNGYTSVDSLKTENYLIADKNYKVKYNATYPAEKMENKLYLSPFLNEPLNENPIKQGIRKYPIDFNYSFGKKFKSIITIPPGYKLEFKPEPLKINNIHVTIEYQIIDLNDNKLMVLGMYTFKRAVYEPNDITILKLYFNDIIKKFNEKIVLVKE